MAKVGLTKGAEEKYKLLMNGIKGGVDNFLKELSEDKINSTDLNIFFEEKGKFIIYYKDLEKINIILTKDKEDIWVILDFLTPQDFSRINKK